MLIQFRIQKKTGSILVIAPDQTIYSVEAESDEAAMAAKLGGHVLKILSDPDQPEEIPIGVNGETMQPMTGRPTGMNDPRGDYPEDAGAAEVHFRRAIDSVVPGGSKVLSWLQELSGSDD